MPSASETSRRRVEHDLIGDRELPGDALYGIHAARALSNFARPGAERVGDVPELCRALGLVKRAALQANVAAGVLDGGVVDALDRACAELAAGDDRLRAGLVVPIVQGGAGTSTNMNVNETLANRALELLGLEPGRYDVCHPNDHVNRSQSTNDVYPTALRLALTLRDRELREAARRLCVSLRAQARRHDDTRKLGRTQLQDAVPMTVGAEFDAWADAVEAAGRLIAQGIDMLLEVNLGGTAIGTGLTAPDAYRESVVERLAQLSGLPLRRASRPVSATTDSSALLSYSAALRAAAVAIAKVSNDIRLLSSGPRAGLAELGIPAVQGGSSIMPGKVNPVIAEYANQLAFRVRGADTIVELALDAAQLQLHAMLPIVTSELLAAQLDLSTAMDVLRTRCIDGIVVDERRTAAFAAVGLDKLAELAAAQGYAQATRAALDGRSAISTTSAPGDETLTQTSASPDAADTQTRS